MLSDYQRKKIAADAVRTVERYDALQSFTITDALHKDLPPMDKNRWYLSIDKGELVEVHEFIASLLVERDEWKRRAAQHGCNTDDGDPDCE